MIAKNRAIDSVLSLQMLCLFELPVFRDGFIDGELAPSDIEGSDPDLGRKVVFDSDDFRRDPSIRSDVAKWGIDRIIDLFKRIIDRGEWGGLR